CRRCTRCGLGCAATRLRTRSTAPSTWIISIRQWYRSESPRNKWIQSEREPMNWCRREPTLKEMLSDSIVRTMMDADGVDSHELEAMLKKVGGRVSPPAER